MTNYFVRQTGADASAGTSAGAAWRTLGKALGAAGIASGDTVYVGAGTYREAVTVSMTSATVETRVIGDVDGAQTGDPGEVIWSTFTAGDWAAPSTNACVNLNGRDFLTFEKLTLLGAGTPNACITATTVTSTDITLRDCALLAQRTSAVPVVSPTVGFGVAANWVIERCRFFGNGSRSVNITLTTGVGADWDANVQIRDCLFAGPHNANGAIFVVASGTAANEGGGVDVTNCTFLGCAGLVTSGTRISLTFPCTIQNCLVITQAATAVNSAEAGALTDGGWNRIIASTAYANVTQANSSRASTFPAVAMSIGQEQVIGSSFVPFSMPLAGAPINAFGPSVRSTDLLNRARPEGDTLIGDTGTATSGTTSTITQTGKTWGINQWTGWLVKTTGGTGPNQIKRISSNTATALTISGAIPAGGLWATTPASGTTYTIFMGPQVETGKATAGAASTLTDGGATWGVDQWDGYTCATTGGTGSGQTATITSNTATVLTRSGTWSVNPDSTTTYSLYAAGSVDDPQDAAGALDRHDTARKETTTTDAGSVGIVIEGRGSHEFRIPVDAAATVITVRACYDTAHAATNKPQAILLANGEIGVATETVTMTSAVDTWETLTFSSFTPTAKGVVTVRLVSRSAASLGKAFFDTWTVT